MAETHCQRRVQGHHGRQRLKSAPIGVFDSGIGGLSVLRALRAELPHEDFVYLADNAHAPYGERDAAYVIARAHAIAQQLRQEHQIKALVVACNTATAAAIHLLRQAHPELPIVGVEPALKPAAAASKTRRIGVMATRGTLASAKFGALREALKDQAEFICQPCDGLASAIERGDTEEIQALCERYTRAMGPFGVQAAEIDTVVLGCTHYPFAHDTLQARLGPRVQLLDSGAPVARQTRRVLQAGDGLVMTEKRGTVTLCASAAEHALKHAAQRWLDSESASAPKRE
jgi:glutamate racemase